MSNQFSLQENNSHEPIENLYKVLVTGGAGFIGSHLGEKLLSAGYKVISLDNLNNYYDVKTKENNIAILRRHPMNANFKHVTEDIRNRSSVFDILESEKPDCVVHLAAMAGVRNSILNPHLYTEVNVTGTQNLLDACAKNDVRRFVFASSSSVYGNNQKVPFSETDNVDFPISPYAASKKAGELLCHVYSYLFQFRICCLRFFTAYGPRQRPDLAIYKFAELMSEGKEIPCYGDGLSQRDYTYIEDIIGGIIGSIKWIFNGNGRSYEIFNLGESQTISLNEMVESLERLLRIKAKIRKMPMQPGDVQCTYADISKSKKILGYSPTTPFHVGLAKFVEWFQSERLLSSSVK